MFLSDIPTEKSEKARTEERKYFLVICFSVTFVLIPGESRAWESVVLLCFLIVFIRFVLPIC